MIIGVLALRVATGDGGRTTDAKGALETLLAQPFGQILLGLAAVGLLGYSMWKFIQAIRDPDREGTDASGLAKRCGYVLSGVIHLMLAFWAGGVLLGVGQSGGGGTTEWTAWLMNQPFGRWLVGIAGAGVMIGGLAQMVEGFRGNLAKRLKVGEVDEPQLTWIQRMGRCGMLARGVVFGLIGWFLIDAALSANPNESGGLDKALDTLLSSPGGAWWLGLTAAGLLLYGAFQVALARYREVQID